MKGIFKATQTIEGKYMIGYNDELFETINFKIPLEKRGSYNVLAARILGISYAEFLRYARDKYNGIISGKGHKYPIVKFNSLADCNSICKELTIKWMEL
jgi:hypothetical protein